MLESIFPDELESTFLSLVNDTYCLARLAIT